MRHVILSKNYAKCFESRKQKFESELNFNAVETTTSSGMESILLRLKQWIYSLLARCCEAFQTGLI